MTSRSNDPPTGRLKPVFPWFGAKTKIADEVWRRFGNPANYVEPFAGTAAVLLRRPDHHRWWEKNETINDADGHIANFHRAVAADPEAVAHHASWPVNEADLTARHLWLVNNRAELTDRITADPDWYDARAAGWWLWGVCAWIGGDWCTGIGPYTGSGKPSISNGGTTPGVYRKQPMISGSHAGKGIHRLRPVSGEMRSLTGSTVPDVITSMKQAIINDLTAIANRLRRVRVTCGDWTRVLGNAAIPRAGHITGVFLDPPYDLRQRRGELYAIGDRPTNPSAGVHEAVREWALQHGNDSRYRIAYCTYSTVDEDTVFEQAGWTAYRWTASGGYGLRAHNRARRNRRREIVWFSPTCLPTQAEPLALFEAA